MGRIKEFDELRRLKQELDIETDRLNGLINRVSILGSSSDSEKVDGGRLNNTEDKYIDIIDLLHQQEAVVKYISNKYYTLEDQVFNNIRKVGEQDSISGFILYERFIKLESPRKIERKVHYSRSRYYDLQEKAIEIYNKISKSD